MAQLFSTYWDPYDTALVQYDLHDVDHVYQLGSVWHGSRAHILIRVMRLWFIVICTM